MEQSENSNGRTGRTIEQFKQAMLDNLYFSQGTAVQSASLHDAYMALATTVRDHLIEQWRKTTTADYKSNPRFVYYLSAEYLLGKQLAQNLLYTDTTELARQVLADTGLKLQDFLQEDVEPGLGNGGLGRLAACFLDSLATLDIPAVGYGIRYEHGIFNQTFIDGWQVERPDNWLLHGNPWEFLQSDNLIEVGQNGHTEHYKDEEGHLRVRWIPEYTVLGESCIMLAPGYKTNRVNILRLWRARASNSFDFQLFNDGDYARAVEMKVHSENISKVLYPNDNTPQGRKLRLKQQYFFVACSLRDIIRRFHLRNDDWAMFPEKVVIQLNDTHPVIAIPELMRILVDENHLEWDRAWDITRRVFAYTCHTLLPEALERWPVGLFKHLLPRHLEIIYEINHRFLLDVKARYPEDGARIQRMSIIEEGAEQQVRMANLACVGSFAVNGVAELHTRLLREQTLRDFAELWPEKFHNKTNGVTPRRFMKLSNGRLSDLITSKIGAGWLNDLEQLRELEAHVDDPGFRAVWREVKQQNKQDLSQYLSRTTAVPINPDAIFDVMVKRLHEYKRQLLKALHIITLYHRLKDNPHQPFVPRTFIFGAKAAPGYFMAKLIIKLINSVGSVVNYDPDVNGRLTVLFPPNFNVSLAERIYPAADISEQISLAGKEASGTGNMKFALNGALTVGTLDGANIEIRDCVGPENFFLFGLTTDEVFATKAHGYNPYAIYQSNPELKRVLDTIAGGRFSHGDVNLFRPIVDGLVYDDQYLLLADYQAYVDCSERAAAAYQDVETWTRMSILNTARAGFFSSDRAMRQYCADTWRVTPVRVP
jgi:glycogen phosphorylase